MSKVNNELIKVILKNDLKRYLMNCNFGLEKENVRVDENGKLALTPHPKVFGDKSKHPYIKTDFSESQVEVITPIFNSIDSTYDFLEDLHDVVSVNLENEYLWPQSNPPHLPEENEIPIAKLDDEKEYQYREMLAEKYGRKKQLISGIHYNFSFKEEFLRKLYEILNVDASYKDFKDGIYLKVSRNVLKYKWILIYLTGASPTFHNTYVQRCKNVSTKIDEESHYFPKVNSVRNSFCGYRNKQDYNVSFNSVNEYIRDLKELVESGKLQKPKEFYCTVRLKVENNDNLLNELLDKGIKYLEIRFLDLNPLFKIGLSKDTLYLIHLFVLYSLFVREEGSDEEDKEISRIEETKTACCCKRNIYKYEDIFLKEKALEIFGELEEFADMLNIKEYDFRSLVQREKAVLIDETRTFSRQIVEGVKEKSYITFHMEKAKEYIKESKRTEFNLKGFEDLELSTQILLNDAIKKGIEFKVIDRDENFIFLKKGDKKEYVKQATKTSKDSYSTVLIMENKLVTKEVLADKNIRVPKGENYNNIETAKSDFNIFKNKRIVIKPKTTNFGIGITIFKTEFSKEDYVKALEMAFMHDKTVLIEEFLTGKEYRFLVIDDEVVGILHRVPANVTGNGSSTIKELAEEKNKDVLRGKGYKTPLEKINLGEAEVLFLKGQGLDINYIPSEGEIIYLRENSNISTGGDSIDFTDDIPKSYYEIAIKCAKAVNARICGVDMVIDNIKEEANKTNHGIIELNFNPAIHIHCYPYKGKNRRAGEKVLDLLFEDIS